MLFGTIIQELLKLLGWFESIIEWCVRFAVDTVKGIGHVTLRFVDGFARGRE